jgi:catechol 2,3-dioxygenase-like lactoylglutathione lyase family enzyme
MNTEKFDRTQGDTGNVVALEHVNIQIPDQQLATLFYVTGLGLTRDPYLFTGIGNMWINIGRNQIHMPTGAPMIVRGSISLVMPDREGLLKRLAGVAAPLAGTRFAFEAQAGHVDATCPWGNRFRIFEPSERFGRMRLGLPGVELDVPRGTAAGIAHFYRQVLGARVQVDADARGASSRVRVGPGQTLVYREGDGTPPAYDNHHVQIYVNDFSGPYERLRAMGLVSQEDDTYQYRFRLIVDPATAEPLTMLEHEVRSLLHPLYARPLVNRNPDISNRNYAAGHESFR